MNTQPQRQSRWIAQVATLALLASCAAPPPVSTTASLTPHGTATEPQSSARAYASAEDCNASNNPLSPFPDVHVQDLLVPDIYRYAGRSDPYANDVLLRGTLPVMDTFLPDQLIRMTVPISTRPDFDEGYTTGLGDVSIFDIVLLGEMAGVDVGVGPLLTMPTASDEELGTEKWSAGLAALAVENVPAGVFGALVQWQRSFAGDEDRQDVDVMTVQPLLLFNTRQAWYVRSTAICVFDFENDDYYVPVGLGMGKVWREGGTILNAFCEPQVTVLHDDTAPQWQVFFGLNMTFGGGGP